MTGPHDATLERFEDALARRNDVEYDLTLFVSGASDLSARAIANARNLCDTHLDGRCRLTVVDLHSEPEAGRRSEVIAAPTLVRNLPLPTRRFIGDLSHIERVLRTLDLPGAATDGRNP